MSIPWKYAEILLNHQCSTQVGTWKRGSGIATPSDLLAYRLGLKRQLTKLNSRGLDGLLSKEVKPNSYLVN